MKIMGVERVQYIGKEIEGNRTGGMEMSFSTWPLFYNVIRKNNVGKKY